MNGRPLKVPAGLSLPPGDYEFYYVPRHRWLLSAEGTAEAGSIDPSKLLPILAQTNGFTLEDLAVNWDGRLAGRQVRGLVLELLKSLVLWILLFVIGVIAIVYILNDFLGKERLPPNWLLGASCSLVFGAFFIGAAAVWGQQELRKILQDISDRRVNMAEGQVDRTVEVDAESDHTDYYYRIGRHTISVSRTGYAALVDGWSYRLYYTPRTKRLASIEPLAAGANTSGDPAGS